ncbi:MAG: Na/Pi cotransporter family protein [Bacteriovoracaceae bacterium]|nr:Na/Pi cotransporter family protein [Bacteriovoracaceae bacterium]
MESSFKVIYMLFGGLGIFFYGMKLLSDSLQSIAGDVIRQIINSLTSNRIFAVLVGLVVTMIIQSSSVTTVMVVGFVNAGLMTLTQAIGVIFGANIGTTITGWLISVSVSKYGLVFVALGFIPALFATSNRWRQIGYASLGVGMVFIGLETMSDAFKPLRTNQEFLNSIAYFSGQNYANYFASIMMGCLLTMIVQSSSAMLGITIALASSGVISFHTAVALVLGENIGTTITAILASIGANVNAKRAARAHATFNLLGVLIIFTAIPYYVEFIDYLLDGVADFTLNDGTKPLVAKHIALAHSMFNITATLCFLPFINYLARFVTKITPDSKIGKDAHHLVVLGNPADIFPATAIVQAIEEMKKCKEILDRMYRMTKEYLSQDKPDAKILAKIHDYENITDNIQKEVTVFIGVVMEKSLSHNQSIDAQAIIRIADEFESIADYLARTANYLAKYNQKLALNGENKAEFMEFMDEVWEFTNLCCRGLNQVSVHDLKLCERTSEKLRIMADGIRDKHIDRVSKGEYDPLSSMTFSDMVVAVRKIRSHALNVAQALNRMNEREV